MAASLESLDQIRDTLISRGIGNSGLAQQAIQRAGLPELSTALATANSIRASEQKKRESDLKRQQLSSLAQLQSNLRSSAKDDSGVPSIGLTDRGFSLKGGLAGVFRAMQDSQGVGGLNVGTFAEDIVSALKRQNEDTIRLEQPSNVLSGLSGLRDQLATLLRQQGVTIV